MSAIPAPGLSRSVRRRSTRLARPLRCATFLAPHLFWFYQHITRAIGRRLDWPIELTEGTSYSRLAEVDVAFVCSLPYVEHARFLQPLAGPVLRGSRYRGRPIYFSDVVVRRDSGLRTFADLRGRSWAYNEPQSQSGYGITRYHLASLGETRGFFGCVIQAGWHERALRLVADGQVDGAAIDSHVLETLVADQPRLARDLRIIASLGPSPIQPVVAAKRLPICLRRDLQAALLDLDRDSAHQECLARAGVVRFTQVADATYDVVRRMRDVAVAAGLSTLG